jgi:hypothetical protein
VNAEYKASVAQQDSADHTLVVLLEVAHKASVAQQDSADRTLVVLLEVAHKASVAQQDSVHHFLMALLVNDVQGHPRYKINLEWIAD